MASIQQFVDECRPEWDELAELVTRAHGRIDRLPAPDVLRLGTRYRAAAADLALARRRYPREAAVAQLDALVAQSRSLVYANQSRRDSVRDFLTRGFWRRVTERPVFLLIAAALLLLPAVVVGGWAHGDPAGGARVAQISPLSSGAGDREDEPRGADRNFSGTESAAFSTQIFTNNIRVAFLAFAGGLTAGLLTVFSLAFNGLILGLVTGLSVQGGGGEVLMRLVVPHGLLELSLIVVAGAAGLRVGWAIVHPGHRTRLESLATEARAAAELALGVAAWLVPCGLVEGFVTPRGLPLGGAWAVGLALAATFWALVIWRGRPPVSEASGGLLVEVGGHAGGGQTIGGGVDHHRPGPAEAGGHPVPPGQDVGGHHGGVGVDH